MGAPGRRRPPPAPAAPPGAAALVSGEARQPAERPGCVRAGAAPVSLPAGPRPVRPAKGPTPSPPLARPSLHVSGFLHLGRQRTMTRSRSARPPPDLPAFPEILPRGEAGHPTPAASLCWLWAPLVWAADAPKPPSERRGPGGRPHAGRWVEGLGLRNEQARGPNPGSAAAAGITPAPCPLRVLVRQAGTVTHSTGTCEGLRPTIFAKGPTPTSCSADSRAHPGGAGLPDATPTGAVLGADGGHLPPGPEPATLSFRQTLRHPCWGPCFPHVCARRPVRSR